MIPSGLWESYGEVVGLFFPPIKPYNTSILYSSVEYSLMVVEHANVSCHVPPL